jgi:alkanesulfonate monooxygenase SsuD/methylene tetrahydromethanopterin reductase-like flavin-dependent oxidoreductase (luciferase family)
MGPVDPIPVYLATLGPKSLEWTGEVAEGWLGASFMPEHAGVFLNHLRAGAARAGRTLQDIDLHAGGVVEFSDDVESLYAARKPGMAFVLGAMGSRRHNFYNEAVQRAGFEGLALEVQDLWLAGRRDDATNLVPNELVARTNLLGTDEMVRERIRAYRDCGVTTLRVDPAGSGPAERLLTLERFMDLLAGINAGG